MLPRPFQNVCILTGPTASGKTALGVELAERMDAEIISMDSMAVYRGMDIGTAKPSLSDRKRVRHHLIDELEPCESGSVAWWLERAAACCRDIEARGKRVLFVGGTPMYLKALLYGLFKGPSANSQLRLQLEQEAEVDGNAALHRRLAAVDPATAARVHPNDQRRIIRALEVWDATGKPISDYQRDWPANDVNSIGEEKVLCLDISRDQLYRRIDERVAQMMADGFVDEVRSLRRLERPLSREAAQAVGYQEIIDFLDTGSPLEDTITRVQNRSRQFAKRQLTWFRHLRPCRMVAPELTFECWGLTI